MDHGDRIAYIQCHNKVGWKLEFKTRDKIQLPKVEEIIISTSTPEARRTNEDCRAANPAGMNGNHSSVVSVEPKLKASTDTGSKVTVDETEIESIPQEKLLKSSDTVEAWTPGDNDKSANQVVVKPYECLICHKSFSQSNHLKNHVKSHQKNSSTGKIKVSLKQRNFVSGKSHICHFCHKSFLYSNNLKNHVKSHERKSNITTKSIPVENEVTSAVATCKSQKPLIKPYKCLTCRRSFLYSNHLKNHVKSHERESNINKTPLSGEKKSDRDSKVHHIRKPFPQVHNIEAHNGKGTFKCTFCHKLFNQPGNLTRHLRIHTGERPHKCSVCLKSFTRLDTLKTHKRSHTGDKPYQCVVCTKSYTQSGSLQAHERIHISQTPYQCSLCEGSFSLLSSLRKHLKAHSEEKSAALKRNNIYSVMKKLSQEPSTTPANSIHVNQSNLYVKQFSVENEVISVPGEQKSTYPIPLKPYKCSICSKSFFQSNHLKNHTKSHKIKSNLSAVSFSADNEVIPAVENCKSSVRVFKPHKCLTCRRSFLHSNHLKNHVKSHKNKSNIGKQPISGTEKRDSNIKVHYLWKQSPVQNLEAELPTQAGKKTFKCTICHKSFIQLENLQTHLRVHTDDKPYKCSFCVKSFREFCVLKVHERLHTGYRPYKCVVCAKSFPQLANVKAHERIHTDQRAYQCSICKGSFSQLSSLKWHMRSHTRGKSAALKRTNILGVERNLCKRPATTSSVNSLTVNPLNFTVVIKSPTNRREKPFRCPICSKLFSQSIHLSEHSKVHTVEKPFQCPSCPRVFSCQNVLKRHLGIHKLLSWRRNDKDHTG